MHDRQLINASFSQYISSSESVAITIRIFLTCVIDSVSRKFYRFHKFALGGQLTSNSSF